jgi:hypothetical protein
MISPFFATAQARHSEKGGAERGRIAAVLGFSAVRIVTGTDRGGEVQHVDFAYDGLEVAVTFKDPAKVAD